MLKKFAALAAGATLRETMELANLAASLVVHQLGTWAAPRFGVVPAKPRIHFGAVIIGKLPTRKGDAGRPSLLHSFTSGKSAQP